MRIAHVITALETGGAETVLAGLLESLAALPEAGDFAHQVVSLMEPGYMAERIKATGVPVLGLGMARGRPSPLALVRLSGHLRRFRPDLVLTWLYHADLLGLLAARLAGVRKVAWNLRCSYMDFSRYSSLTRLTVRACALLSRRPVAVLANSQAALDHHRALGYRPRQGLVVFNGIDARRFRPDQQARADVRAELGLAEEDLVAGMAARFDPMKDLPVFFRAAQVAVRQAPRTHFVLCGKGMDPDNPELARLVGENGLSGRISLLGQRPDIERVMAAWDVGLSSSLGESFPNQVAEAMACGLPCVVTRAGASAEVLGEAGSSVPVGDGPALGRALADLLAMDAGERRALGLAGRERVRREYTLERMALAYADFFRSQA